MSRQALLPWTVLVAIAACSQPVPTMPATDAPDTPDAADAPDVHDVHDAGPPPPVVTKAFPCGSLTCQPGEYCFRETAGITMSVALPEQCSQHCAEFHVENCGIGAGWCCNCEKSSCEPLPAGCNTCACLPGLGACKGGPPAYNCEQKADGSLVYVCRGV